MNKIRTAQTQPYVPSTKKSTPLTDPSINHVHPVIKLVVFTVEVAILDRAIHIVRSGSAAVMAAHLVVFLLTTNVIAGPSHRMLPSILVYLRVKVINEAMGLSYRFQGQQHRGLS